MLEETTLQEVVVKIRNKEKQHVFTIDLTLNQMGEINLSEVNHRINDIYSMDEGLMFYFDRSQDTYICLQPHEQILIHQSSLINENMISLRFQSQISDEQQANHEIKQESNRTKRSRERIISDAFLIMEQWRLLYLDGIQNEKGQRQKVNLDQAAGMLGTPRKTLQDYFLLFRNGKAYGFDFKNNCRSKIGILRSYVKQHKKQEKQKKQMKERRLLKGIRRQLFGITPEELEMQLFSMRESGSSDQDLIFFQH